MNRRRILVMLLILLAFRGAFAQTAYHVSYADLKNYEGLYEFKNGMNLKIAASPKDTILFSILNTSLYPLRPFSKDVFLNSFNDTIRFYRTGNLVKGYILDKDSFGLISSSVVFPRQMWYPRANQTYTYQKPANTNDGIPVGALEGTGLNKARLDTMMRKIIVGDYPDVHSILIIKNGKLVFEEYFYEYTRDSLQELRSASKSFVSALMGIVIDKGYIKSVNEKVIPFFPEYELTNMSPLKNQITIQNLLANESGLDCDISNSKSEGNETKMDYSSDWVRFTLNLPLLDSPGTKGMYCSGNPVTIGRIIEKATKQKLPDFANRMLFTPLSITSFKWNFKPDSTNAEDFCQVYLTPRSMAKLGQLYLQDGKWHGQQIVSAAWVKESWEKHSVVQGVDYGYLWWLKHLDSDGVRYYGKAAQGNGGQKIYIWPALNMVTVITGGNYNRQSPSDELISKYILSSFNKN
jgi:CubicO group peptidase (beta-lactamase class C family)